MANKKRTRKPSQKKKKVKKGGMRMPDVSEPETVVKVCKQGGPGGGMSNYVDRSEWPEGLEQQLKDLLDEHSDFLSDKGVKYNPND